MEEDVTEAVSFFNIFEEDDVDYDFELDICLFLELCSLNQTYLILLIVSRSVFDTLIIIRLLLLRSSLDVLKTYCLPPLLTARAFNRSTTILQISNLVTEKGITYSSSSSYDD